MLSALMEAMGYCFRDESLLRLALMHPSLTPEKKREDNQRLEFLGDAVLQLCVSQALYHGLPAAKEGELTRKRIALVREETLCEAAQRLNLGRYIRMDYGEQHTGGSMKASILADALEAVIAAVYLDGGLPAAEAFAARALEDYRDPHQEDRMDWKSMLQEALQAQGKPAPTYAILSTEGPPHEPVFTAEVRSEEEPMGVGSGKSKKEAEQQAAMAACRRIEATAKT